MNLYQNLTLTFFLSFINQKKKQAWSPVDILLLSLTIASIKCTRKLDPGRKHGALCPGKIYWILLLDSSLRMYACIYYRLSWHWIYNNKTLSKFSCVPSVYHYRSLKGVAKYLQTTITCGVQFLWLSLLDHQEFEPSE